MWGLTSTGINYTDLWKLKVSKKEADTIFKDISRIFPKHVFFEEKHGVGQKTLFDVLKCISLVFKETGYVQAMVYIASVLLMYMNEEDAFWTMVSIMSKYDQKKYYVQSMGGVWESFYILQKFIELKMPKLHQHMLESKITPSMYATQWFMTLFTTGFEFECTVRIYDSFFAEGPKILFRVALFILKNNQAKLLKADLGEFFDILRQFYATTSADKLIDGAVDIDITREQIAEFETEYHSDPDQAIFTFMKG